MILKNSGEGGNYPSTQRGYLVILNTQTQTQMNTTTAQSLKYRINAVNCMSDILSIHRKGEYAGRIIVTNCIANVLKDLDKSLCLNWLCIGEIDGRYFDGGIYSDPMYSKHYKVVFLNTPDGTEYSFDNLPYYLRVGYSNN